MIYTHGLHEPGGEHLMEDAPGWIVFTERLFHDPSDYSGRDYREWADRGFRIIVRLNHDYFPGGTLPERAFYADFAQRVQNFVASSSGAFLWIVGNEPNHSQERPHDQPITPADYVECFNLCAVGIHSVGPQHKAIIAPVAPWNVETGDWLEYFSEVLDGTKDHADGIGAHTNSHGSDPALITSMQTMDPPYQDRLFHFRAYRDFIARIPPELARLPVYITEANQNDPWLDDNNGWVQAAYKEIDNYNQAAFIYGGSMIHCLCLYRWPRFDQWYIMGKNGVIDDFRAAVEHGYTVPEKGDPPVSESLLINGGMERPYEHQLDKFGNKLMTVYKPHGWTAFWYGVMPEYKPVESQYQNRIHSGETAAQWFKKFDKPNGGLYQVVTGLQPGATYRLTGWAQFWAVYKNGNDVPASFETRVDLYGGTDPDNADNLRSDPIHPHNEWRPVNALEFEAKSDRSTVFLIAIFVDPGQDMNAYADTFELVKISGDTEPPDPPLPGGECDVRSLYAAKAQEAKILCDAYLAIEQMYHDLATGEL